MDSMAFPRCFQFWSHSPHNLWVFPFHVIAFWSDTSARKHFSDFSHSRHFSPVLPLSESIDKLFILSSLFSLHSICSLASPTSFVLSLSKTISPTLRKHPQGLFALECRQTRRREKFFLSFSLPSLWRNFLFLPLEISL